MARQSVRTPHGTHRQRASSIARSMKYHCFRHGRHFASFQSRCHFAISSSRFSHATHAESSSIAFSRQRHRGRFIISHAAMFSAGFTLSPALVDAFSPAADADEPRFRAVFSRSRCGLRRHYQRHSCRYIAAG